MNIHIEHIERVDDCTLQIFDARDNYRTKQYSVDACAAKCHANGF